MGDTEVEFLYSLAGLVQKITQDCKIGLPLFEELVVKTAKLQTQLLSTSTILSSFLDTFQKIADTATNTKGSSTDIGICLTRIVIRHRAIEAHLRTLTRALSDCFTFPIQNKIEEWRGIVKQIDREHTREFKKMRSLIKKKSDQIRKIRKKLRKEKTTSNLAACDQYTKELDSTVKSMEEKEKQVVKKIAVQERTHFTTLAASFKPIIGEEYEMLQEIEQLTEVMDKLNRIISDPRIVVESSNNVVNLIEVAKDKFSYATPPSSPSGSNIGSRRGSITSNSSSRASSVSRGSSVSRASFTDTDNYMSDSEEIAKITNRDSIISTRSQDSGYPSLYFPDSTQPLFISEDDLQATPTRRVGPQRAQGEDDRLTAGQGGRSPAPVKPRPPVPDRSSSLEGSRTTSPEIVKADPLLLPSSLLPVNSTGGGSRQQDPFAVSGSTAVSRQDPFTGSRSDTVRSRSLSTGTASQPSSSSASSDIYSRVQKKSLSHYGVPRGTPVFREQPRKSASEYSVPKPVLPSLARDKLDLVLPLPIYMNTQMSKKPSVQENPMNLERSVPSSTSAGREKNVQQTPAESKQADLTVNSFKFEGPGLDTEDDMITPTIEQLSILELKIEEGKPCSGFDTSSGSGSMGSSSGYGSTGFDHSSLEDTAEETCSTAGGYSSTSSADQNVLQWNLQQQSSRIQPPNFHDHIYYNHVVGRTTDTSVLNDISGVETSTGTLKRSQSVGVAQPTAFDRQHPARQSIAGEWDRSAFGHLAQARDRAGKLATEKSFIPKPNKAKSLRPASEIQSESRLPRIGSQLKQAVKLRQPEVGGKPNLVHNVYSV